MRVHTLFYFIFFFCPFFLSAQTDSKIVIRYDYRVYENNRYQGFRYGEVRSKLTYSDEDLQVNQFQLEELTHDGRFEQRFVNNEIQGNFALDPNGYPIIPPGEDALVFRRFPALPDEKYLEIGMEWVAEGELLVDPLQSGNFTVIPILVQYKVTGSDEYAGREVWVLESLYALRYRGYDYYGDERIERSSGSHASVIYLEKSTLNPLFFRTTAEEQFQLEGGELLSRKGFLLCWFEDVLPFRSEETPERVIEILDDGDAQDIEVSEVEEGIRLRLKNLLFVADSARLLPGESERLDTLARALQEFGDRTILISGHTANIGSRESQLVLSRQRAELIAQEMVRRGVAAQRILFQGLGGDYPVADNGTEEGRVLNRRVEITVLQD